MYKKDFLQYIGVNKYSYSLGASNKSLRRCIENISYLDSKPTIEVGFSIAMCTFKHNVPKIA